MEMYKGLLDLEMLPERIQVAPGQQITRECIRDLHATTAYPRGSCWRPA